jgi:hypothetical protein
MILTRILYLETRIDVDDTPIISNRSHLDETTPNDDTDTYCTICKQSFSSSHYYNEHMTEFHKNNVTFARKTTVQPVIEDSPCYCRSCEYQFASIQCHRRHLINVHKMELEPLQKWGPRLKAQPNIIPVVDYPTITCRSCGHQFCQKLNYRLHLINVHKMKLEPLKK